MDQVRVWDVVHGVDLLARHGVDVPEPSVDVMLVGTVPHDPDCPDASGGEPVRLPARALLSDDCCAFVAPVRDVAPDVAAAARCTAAIASLDDLAGMATVGRLCGLDEHATWLAAGSTVHPAAAALVADVQARLDRECTEIRAALAADGRLLWPLVVADPELRAGLDIDRWTRDLLLSRIRHGFGSLGTQLHGLAPAAAETFAGRLTAASRDLLALPADTTVLADQRVRPAPARLFPALVQTVSYRLVQVAAATADRLVAADPTQHAVVAADFRLDAVVCDTLDRLRVGTSLYAVSLGTAAAAAAALTSDG